MFLKTSVAVLAGVAVAASSLSPVLASEPVDVCGRRHRIYRPPGRTSARLSGIVG